MNAITVRTDDIASQTSGLAYMTLAPIGLPLSLSDLDRWFSTGGPGSTIAYHRGFLAMDRGAGSRLGEEAGDELDRIATALMAMADAGQVHLIQRRHGAYDYSYLAVAARSRGRRGSGRTAREIAS